MCVCAICTLLAFTVTSLPSEELCLTFSIAKMGKTNWLGPICYPWILHSRVHLHWLGMKHDHRFWSESGLCNLHTGWHGYSRALVPQWKAGLPAASVVPGSAGGTWAATVLICPWLPQPLWHLTSRGMKGCPEAGHSIIPFATQDQGKHPGRHIPGTLDSLYCQRIAKSVKLTEISTSLWRCWESTRDSQHEVVENQSWYEKESWLNPSLKELVLRFWVT